MSNTHDQNHMSTIVLNYHCCDSNTDDNDSHAIATIAQPYNELVFYVIEYWWGLWFNSLDAMAIITSAVPLMFS